MTDSNSAKHETASAASTSGVRAALDSRLEPRSLTWSEFRSQQRVDVPAANIELVLKTCRSAGMDQLVDLTVVDLLEYPGASDRFQIIYLLLNTESGERLTVRTYLNEPNLTIPSAVPIWFGADWLEREAYDMYGIVFSGHPNFKRLLLPAEFESFPLRKDYPVKGRGERHNFPIITRAES
jgi:NADH-quinone oxidoreductase subunit C